MNTWKLINSAKSSNSIRQLTMQYMICDNMTSSNRFLKNFQVFLCTILPKELDQGGFNNFTLSMRKLSF